MNDAEYEEAKQRINAVAQRWAKPLGLLGWAIEYDYHREGIPAEAPDSKDGYYCTAKTAVRWQYLDATIHFNVPFLAEASDKKLEWIMVHEFAHVLVNELRDVSDDWLKHEERVCTILANALIWVRDATLEAKDG